MSPKNPQQNPEKERRQALRAKRILSIQYRLVKSKSRNPDTQWHLSTTHDMSLSGIAFLSEVPYQVEDILEIQVIMSGVLDIFKGQGKVVRVEKKKTGVFYLIAIRLLDQKSAAKTAKKSAEKAKSGK